LDGSFAMRWRALTQDVTVDTRLLSNSEAARLARIRDPGAQRRFGLGRSLIHELLGDVLGLPRAEIPVIVDTGGRPGVDLPGVTISIAHAPTLVAVAVGLAATVGVDVEHRQRSPLPEPRRWLSPEEAEELTRRPSHQRQAYLLRLWTGKEAATKALGLGMAMPFRRLEVDAQRGCWWTRRAPTGAGDVIWPGFVSDHVIALALLRTSEQRRTD
jgi:4'-phosphopantetheinyl transferase